MIKANVITKNLSWYRYIKNPNSYIDRKIKKLNNKNKKLKKSTLITILSLKEVDLIQSMMNSQDQEAVQALAMIKSQNQNLTQMQIPILKMPQVTKKVNNHMKVVNLTKINKTLN